MFGNFFRITFRNILKNKVYSFVNILGLVTGISVCLFIFSYVFYELSYDNFLPNGDRIYRLVSKYHLNGRESKLPYTVGGVGDEALKSIPGIDNMFRIHHYNGIDLEYENFKTSNFSVAYVDNGIFEIFELPFKQGVAKTSLAEPFSVVLTARVATALFGDKDALNQSVKIDGKAYLVTGVLEELPNNFHLNVFDVFTSMSSVITTDYNILELEGTHFPTYFLLNENASFSEVSKKIDALATQLVKKRFEGYGMEVENYLQPLSDIHLSKGFSVDYSKTVNVLYLYLFSALALFIITVAVLNFINLTTASYEKRSKEVGIRKVVGARKIELIRQYIGESIIIALISFLVALIVVEISASEFVSLIGYAIPVVYYQKPLLLVLILLFVVVIGFVSGIYPAFYLSGISPVKVLKGVSKGNGKKDHFRKILLVLQFSIAIFIISCLILLYHQIQFVKNKDLGFDDERVLVIQNLTDEIRNAFHPLKAELLQLPEVQFVTASQSVPGKDRVSNDIVNKIGEDRETGVIFNVNRVQHDYLSTFGISLKYGRDFSKDFRQDTLSAIINEYGAKKLGLDDPLGKQLEINKLKLKVIGVVNDYNVYSLYRGIGPVLINMQSLGFRYISLKINVEITKPLLHKIEKKLKNTDPNYVLDYYMVDQSFRQMYEEDERMFKLFTYASILAVIISILGLYALTAFTIHRRYKEIAVRKVLGSSVKSITVSLVYSMTKWVLLAAAFACPLAYYFMSGYFLRFEYRVNVLNQWWVFVLAVFIVYSLSFITVYFKSKRAASVNPVESLKYE